MIDIREIERGEEEETASVISLANSKVLEDLGISKDSWPRHQSNCRKEIITGALGKREKIFIAYLDQVVVGTLSLKEVASSVEIKRLSVHPGFQQMGIGSQLIEFGLSYSKNLGTRSVKLGAIKENFALINWYKKHGFIPKKSKNFKGIPVTILFMELSL